MLSFPGIILLASVQNFPSAIITNFLCSNDFLAPSNIKLAKQKCHDFFLNLKGVGLSPSMYVVKNASSIFLMGTYKHSFLQTFKDYSSIRFSLLFAM